MEVIKAIYDQYDDFIQIPKKSMFRRTKYSTATENYYGTLLHELIHWTGHYSRCNRDILNEFGDRDYAFEEIVAELGSAFLFAELSITAEPRSEFASYIKNWLERLKKDKKFIFQAAGYATNAANFLGSFEDNQKLRGYGTISYEKASLESENSSSELFKNCLSFIEEGETLVNEWMEKIASQLEQNQIDRSTRETLKKEFKAELGSISTRSAKLKAKLNLSIEEQYNLWNDPNNSRSIEDRVHAKINYLRWLVSGLYWINGGIRTINSCFYSEKDPEIWKIDQKTWITKGVGWKEEGQNNHGSYMLKGGIQSGSIQENCVETILHEYSKVGFSVRLEQTQAGDNFVIEVFKRFELPNNLNQNDLRMALKDIGWNILES